MLDLAHMLYIAWLIARFLARYVQIVYFNDFGPDVLYVAGQVMGTYEPLKGINSVHSVHD